MIPEMCSRREELQREHNNIIGLKKDRHNHGRQLQKELLIPFERSPLVISFGDYVVNKSKKRWIMDILNFDELGAFSSLKIMTLTPPLRYISGAFVVIG